jgi:hypothetical protein
METLVGLAVPDPPVTLIWAVISEVSKMVWLSISLQRIPTAGDIELGNSRGPRVVDGELLDSQQIFAVGNAGRDLVCVGL